jgi:DNA topoisomerase-1
MGVDLENNFTPTYVVIPKRKKILAELKKEVKTKDEIWLAPDLDREGEAISWHLANSLGKGKKVYRVVFNEITKDTILESFRNPRDIDMNLVNAQQARRVLDRIVGYSLSPLLWKKVRRGLSAGRVQSVAVRLIVEREQEIESFVPQEYWIVEAELKKKLPQQQRDKDSFIARLEKIDKKKAQVKTKEEADRHTEALKKEEFIVTNIEEKTQKRKPAAPFTTSKLQQDAFNKLRFSAKKTMMLAQQLYEGLEIGDEGSVGLITYMRTDSVRCAAGAIAEVRKYIGGNFGKEYLPASPNVYKSKKGAQEAHEAIRPTSVRREPEMIKNFLTPDQYKLYHLIWTRFVSSQMKPAVFAITTVNITAGRYDFKARGSRVLFPGYTVVYMEEKKEEEKLLPGLVKSEHLDLVALIPSQHFTKPPPRYSEASLVKALEEKGIGRPSTYAPIIHTILSRGYVKREKGYFHPTELGKIVTGLLIESFPEVMDVEFTAGMEDKLDEIETGEVNWVEVVGAFYRPFRENLVRAKEEMKNVKKEQEKITEERCERCGKLMMIKLGKQGKFLACTGFPQCKNTKSIEIGPNGELKILEEEVTSEICDKCQRPMVVKWGRKGRFLSCSGYPECKNAKPISTGIPCPREGCNGELVERRSRKGAFYGCSCYPKCKYICRELPQAGNQEKESA